MWPRGESAVVGRDEELAFLAGELDRRSPSAVRLLYARALVTGHLSRRCGEFHSRATRNVSPGPASSVSHLASSDSTVVDLPTRPVRRQHFPERAPLLRF
jgi:hypothetical protein